MIAQILPLIRLPKSLGIFIYSIPLNLTKKISIGQLVAVNFRGKDISGLVVKLEKKVKKIKFQLKPIDKIITPISLITEKQIKLINFIVGNYGLSPGLMAKSLVPEIPRNHKNTKTQKSPYGGSLPLRVIYRRQTVGRQKNSKSLFWYGDEKEALNLIKEKIIAVLKNKTQILILAPEINLIDKIIQETALKESQVVKIHSRLKKTEYFSVWQKILTGEAKIIIGTKIAVLLPFNNLEKIIIFNEHDWNHKQSDINPRYDARTLAQWLAKIYQSELILTTPAPSVETYFYKNNGPRFNELKKKENNIIIIDLKQERLAGNYNFISDKLLEQIKEKLKTNQKIFLFHNRIGFAKFVSCHDCGYIFQCPNCKINLNYETKNKQLICGQCDYLEDMPPLCPKCAGPDIKFKSAGVQKIKSELIKSLPKIKVLALEKSLKISDVNNYDIVIGTKFAFNKINLKNFDLIAFVNFDQLLNIADFRANEKAYQLFYELKSQNPAADFIIQTNNTENQTIKSISENNSFLFYDSELKIRAELNYPPFCQIIKLTSQNKIAKKAENELKKIAQKIKEKFQEIEILGPLSNNPAKIRGLYKYHLILKIKTGSEIKKILTILPDNIIIDVNPEKLT